MSALASRSPYAPKGGGLFAEVAASWLLAIFWILPLVYAVWTAFHPAEFSTRFAMDAPLTLDNFRRAWAAAPFARYFFNSVILVALVFGAQVILCTLAAYAFARHEFFGKGIAFALVLLQLMIMPDVLVVENYRTMSTLGILDSIPAIALPYVASAFGIFLLRQTFKTVPKELDDAARLEGASDFQVLLKVYVPLAKPVYVAYGLVSVSYHWNNFLWPLIVTNSVESRPVTVGLQVFSSGDQGVDWAIISAATLMTSAPLLIAFLIFSVSSCKALCAPAFASHPLRLSTSDCMVRRRKACGNNDAAQYGGDGPDRRCGPRGPQPRHGFGVARHRRARRRDARPGRAAER